MEKPEKEIECQKCLDQQRIPAGLYCYNRQNQTKITICPFWELRDDKPEQENGYCHYLKCGDWESSYTSLLWDMVKECGINSGD